MSLIHFVEGKIDLAYSNKNLIKILNKGCIIGHSYHIFAGFGTNTKRITPEEVVRKMAIEAEDDSFMLIKDQESLSIRLYKTNIDKDDGLNITKTERNVETKSANPERKKDFLEGHHGMDFAYYIEKFVDFYYKFNIISLEANYYF